MDIHGHLIDREGSLGPFRLQDVRTGSAREWEIRCTLDVDGRLLIAHLRHLDWCESVSDLNEAALELAGSEKCRSESTSVEVEGYGGGSLGEGRVGILI